MENFYDKIRIDKLAKLAMANGYPKRVLVLGLHMHMAVRSLECDEQFPGDVLTFNGIIAGCTQSTSWAKS